MNDSETFCKQYLEKTFNRPVFQTRHFHPYDLFLTDDDTPTGIPVWFFEVKGRNNACNAFPDTLVGTNKIEWIEKQISNNPSLKASFYFCFSDQVCSIDYDKERFNTYSKRKVYSRLHTVIPVSHLTLIDKLESPLVNQPSSVKRFSSSSLRSCAK